MVLSLICVVLVIAFVITMLIPEVSRTITAIGQQFPSTMEAIKNWAVNLAAGYPDIVDRIMEIDIAWDKVSESAINLIKMEAEACCHQHLILQPLLSAV